MDEHSKDPAQRFARAIAGPVEVIATGVMTATARPVRQK